MKPTAVLISDVHYSVHTLSLADVVMRQAIQRANDLGVHLIVAGDIHDTKANLRGECVKAMIDTIQLCKITPIILVGNHDKINEKSEEHSLEFLRPYAHIVDKPNLYRGDKTQNYEYCVPYQYDLTEFISVLTNIPKGSRIIMHQGLKNSLSGEYVLDRTAVPNEWVQDYRVISGHYHTRQDIKTGILQEGAVGTFSYIGNPYTLNFGEAKDPTKGFQILMDDGSLEFVPTNLRKHTKIMINLDWRISTNDFEPYNCTKDDILWFNITGPQYLLDRYTKTDLKKEYNLIQDFRVTYNRTDGKTSDIHDSQIMNQDQRELLNTIIDDMTNTDDICKIRLKEMVRQICE
jgi:DNA repair exonuclease SbcCD nuclease subunit